MQSLQQQTRCNLHPLLRRRHLSIQRPNLPPARKKRPSKSVSRCLKSRSAHDIAKKRLPSAKLDLHLPPEMVRQLRPLGTVPMPAHKPLLPNMFGEKSVEESPFQLNGRLLSNEMDLQLRNEYRRNEIEGAALDFEFKQ